MAQTTPLFLDADGVAAALPWQPLIDALQAAFRDGGATVPDRQYYPLDTLQTGSPMLLVMPAWSKQLGVGTKLVSVYPDNQQRGLPSIHGLYLLMDPADGRPVAVLDGGELTARRTAAASALASRALSREDSRCLLMVGTGRLARCLPLAHATTRPIERVLVWGRSLDRAEQAARELQADGLAASAIESLADGAAQADIVSCATLANEPLLRGEWLRPGTHVDLVGAFTPAMREIDEQVFARARSVWCDTRAALDSAGDILQAVARGTFNPADTAGDLAALCRVEHSARRDREDITVFKSVGMALEDLAAARLCVDRHSGFSRDKTSATRRARCS